VGLWAGTDKLAAMGMLLEMRMTSPAQIVELKASPDKVTNWISDASGEPTHIDLGKAWHGVSYLLTGSGGGGDEEPWCFLLTGGEDVGEDRSYGPARILQPQQVKEWANALTTLSTEQLKKRYNPEDMDDFGVYPSGWTEEPEESLSWLLEFFDELRNGVNSAADQGFGLVIELS
jgi:hypothetical protein